MLRIIFQNYSCGKRFEYIIQRHAIFDHLLLSVLRDAKVFSPGLQPNMLQNNVTIVGI